ncbi:hypothetical protein [Vibrio sp. Vb339]|uniref:hypothetical protein n=1 Tax=Vibrio sp. Vb339 TaxID=1192013 RepID=UPI0015571D7F|nr:hypothetical protein [Vibrio sp. Vb339]
MKKVTNGDSMIVMAKNTMSYLMYCHVKGLKYQERGRSSKEIFSYTNKNTSQTSMMLSGLIKHRLVEEFDWLGQTHYRAINVPKHLNENASLNDILSYSESAISSITFD